MIFKIKNLIIDFHYELPEENWMGVCDLYIDKKHMLDFIDDNADTHLDWDNIDADIDWSKHCGFLEFGEDCLMIFVNHYQLYQNWLFLIGFYS